MTTGSHTLRPGGLSASAIAKSYFVRRLAAGLFIVVFVTIVVFFVTRVVSDPARVTLPIGAPKEQYLTLKHQLGLDRPILTQFVEFVGDMASLDFGESTWQQVPARGLVADRLPATIVLVTAGIALALIIALPFGLLAALRPGSVLDRVMTSVSLVGLSLPQFWLGAMLIFIFAIKLGWLPTSGRGGLDHLVLPALTLALPTAGRLAQVTRATLIDELNKPYAAVARAKGFSEAYVLTRHALRNALIPVVTLAGYELAYGLAGYAVIVETVFAWPGFGYLAIQAIQHNDVFLIQAVVFTAALIVMAVNIAVDYSYRIIDPRIRLR